MDSSVIKRIILEAMKENNVKEADIPHEDSLDLEEADIPQEDSLNLEEADIPQEDSLNLEEADIPQEDSLDLKEADIPQKKSLDLENLGRSKRYFDTKGFAWFRCPQKQKDWPSVRAWCVIDLKLQEICHRYYQKCNKCDSKAYPNFTVESLKKMAEYAVKQFLIRTGRLSPSAHVPHIDTGITKGGPHDEERCGKCKSLGRSCWK